MLDYMSIKEREKMILLMDGNPALGCMSNQGIERKQQSVCSHEAKYLKPPI